MKRYLVLTLLLLNMSCTENARSRFYGGTSRIDLPNNIKLVNVTWKKTNLWYFVRPMRDNEVSETYYFHESSNFGVLEGTIKCVEHKD